MYNSVCNQIVTAFAFGMALFHNHIRKQCAHKSNRGMGSDGADKNKVNCDQHSSFLVWLISALAAGRGRVCGSVCVCVGGGGAGGCACVCVHACVCLHVCVCARIRVCVCAHACVHACVCVCVVQHCCMWLIIHNLENFSRVLVFWSLLWCLNGYIFCKQRCTA